MAKKTNEKSDNFVDNLTDWANEYIEECLANKKDVATGSGKIVNVRDRHIPTIDFFLNIWLPRKHSDTISRKTWYVWLNDNEGADKDPVKQKKRDTIKEIDAVFQALASDIVANEGKGIFYAKNKLGWTDKMQQDLNTNVNILSIDPLTDATPANNSTKKDSGTKKKN